MTAFQECRVVRGSRSDRIEHFSTGAMDFVLGAPTSKGSTGMAELWATIEGVLSQPRVVAVRLRDKDTRVACASAHLPPRGCTTKAFEKALGELTVATTWMEEWCGTRWCIGGDLNAEAAEGPPDDWIQGPARYDRAGENWRQREFRIWQQTTGVRRLGTCHHSPPSVFGRGNERNTHKDDPLSPVGGPDAVAMPIAPPTHPGNLTDHHQVKATVEWEVLEVQEQGRNIISKKRKFRPDLETVGTKADDKKLANKLADSGGDKGEAQNPLWQNPSEALYDCTREVPQKPRAKNEKEWKEIGRKVEARNACDDATERCAPTREVTRKPLPEEEAGQRNPEEGPASPTEDAQACAFG